MEAPTPTSPVLSYRGIGRVTHFTNRGTGAKVPWELERGLKQMRLRLYSLIQGVEHDGTLPDWLTADLVEEWSQVIDQLGELRAQFASAQNVR